MSTARVQGATADVGDGARDGEGSTDRIESLRGALLRSERAVPTWGLGRLWRTGRSAAGMASAVLGGRLRGRGEGLGAADLESVAKMVTQLGELKGVAMKMGQILGYVDPSLPPELRGLLSLLQTASAASPFSAVEDHSPRWLPRGLPSGYLHFRAGAERGHRCTSLAFLHGMWHVPRGDSGPCGDCLPHLLGGADDFNLELDRAIFVNHGQVSSLSLG